MNNMSEVISEQVDGQLILTMNRPAKRNAISTIMLAELIYALEHANLDSSVRVVVLRGAGKGFCPGDDLSGMGALPKDFPCLPKLPVNHASIQSALRDLPKPTIAAIHGFAFGVGLDLAMACDFRIATDDAQIRDQRVIDRGMHAVTGCAWFQPRAIGVSRALEFLILGKPYTGAEAATVGMVTTSVAPDEFDGAITELSSRLASAPTKAIGLMKKQIYQGLEMNHQEFHAFASPLIRKVAINDRDEGIKAFLDKRPPNFTGE